MSLDCVSDDSHGSPSKVSLTAISEATTMSPARRLAARGQDGRPRAMQGETRVTGWNGRFTMQHECGGELVA